ncbi:MAG: hypothetical protein IPN68_15790 [Bacteroidetes bacterium]|nr:hypothetical protein [Bacteroidota bacterium]
MKKIILFAIIFISGYTLSAQVSECKVLLPRLSGTYEGECRKDLAHGKGLAQGIDRYEGEFRKGYPDGRGTYRWADGTFFEGYWKQGLREGSGRMIYSADSIITGYWKADKYSGKQDLKQYEILQTRYIARTSFTRNGDSPSQVKIKLMLGGLANNDVQDFSLIYSSGEEFRLGAAYVVQNVTYPVTIRITYLTWNVLHTVLSPAAIEFRINDPGNWDVNIQN